MLATQILGEQLHAAGIPIVGVSDLGGGEFRVDFAEEATQQQMDDAAAIVAAFDPAAEMAAQEAIEAQEGLDFSGLKADIAGELTWITGAITEIDTGLGAVDAATLAQLRVIVKGLLQNQRRVLLEQQREMKAWRFVIRQAGQ